MQPILVTSPTGFAARGPQGGVVAAKQGAGVVAGRSDLGFVAAGPALEAATGANFMAANAKTGGSVALNTNQGIGYINNQWNQETSFDYKDGQADEAIRFGKEGQFTIYV
jgi:hypothetical protein